MISIVTPTYNRANLLINTIESVRNQSFPDWELIIVDDGSTDNTKEKIKIYTVDKRIKYIRKNNSGATHSRNVGAENAQGDFITFLDSDDEALPNWLERVNQELDQQTAFLCVGAKRKFSDGREALEYPWDYRIYNENLKLKFTCGSLIMKRSIFNDLGGYDIQLKSNQHTDLGFRLLEHLKNSPLKKRFLNECLIQINIHQGERIRTNWKLVKEGGLQFLGKHYNFLKQNDNTRHISDIYAVIAFSNYKLKDRKESIRYVLKAIQYNPYKLKNYLKVFKYSFL